MQIYKIYPTDATITNQKNPNSINSPSSSVKSRTARKHGSSWRFGDAVDQAVDPWIFFVETRWKHCGMCLRRFFLHLVNCFISFYSPNTDLFATFHHPNGNFPFTPTHCSPRCNFVHRVQQEFPRTDGGLLCGYPTFMGKPIENPQENHGKMDVYPLVMADITMERSTIFNGNMGAISAGPCSIANCQSLPEGNHDFQEFYDDTWDIRI